jgi:hypothetical protein
MCGSAIRLELGGGGVAQLRVGALGLVHTVQELSDLIHVSHLKPRAGIVSHNPQESNCLKG